MPLEPDSEGVLPLMPVPGLPEPPEPLAPVPLLSLEVLLSLELPEDEFPVPPEVPEWLPEPPGVMAEAPEWLPEESAEPAEAPEPPTLSEGLDMPLLPWVLLSAASMLRLSLVLLPEALWPWPLWLLWLRRLLRHWPNSSENLL